MSGGSQVQHRLRHATEKRLAQICVALAVAVVAGAMTGQIGAKPALAYACTDYGWQYDVNTKYGSVHVGVGPVQKNYNYTPNPASMTFTSSTSGTVGVTVSVSGTFDINAIFAGAKITTSIALVETFSVTVGNNITVTIASHRYGNAQYGGWVWKTYGHYYYLSPTCVISHSQYITTYVPENAVGWKVWQSTT